MVFEIRDLPLSSIRPSAHQARKDFDEAALGSLAESMKRDGLLNPILVRPVLSAEGRVLSKTANSGLSTQDSALPYELISGERRFRAAKQLGWTRIAARVLETTDESDAAVKGLIENLQREDLNPIEEAEGFADLQRIDPKRWKQDAIAESIGRPQSYVSASLSLLGLPEAVRENIRHRIFSRNHGIELARLPTPELQQQVAGNIGDQLTVHETRRLVDAILKGEKEEKKAEKRKKVDPENVDPLLSIWGEIKSKADLGAEGFWTVVYPKPGTWRFEVTLSKTGKPAEGLSRWAGLLSKALGQGLAKAITKAPKAARAQQQLNAFYGSLSNEEFARFSKVKPKIPKSAGEKAAYLAEAKRGPGAAYAWLYGKNHPFTKTYAGLSWADVGEKNWKSTALALLEVD